MATKIIEILFSAVVLGAVTAQTNLAQTTVAPQDANATQVLSAAQVKAVPYENLRAAHDFALKSHVASDKVAAYEWGKARLDAQEKDFQDINLVARMADAAGMGADFEAFCLKKSDGAEPFVAACAAIQLADGYSARGDAKKAEDVLRKALAFGEACPMAQYHGAASRLSSLLAAKGDKEGAAAALVLILKYPATPTAGTAQKIVALGAPPEILADCVRALRERMAAAPVDAQEFRARSERVLSETVDLLVALNRGGDALRECRAYLLLASDKSYPQAVELSAPTLKNLDGNLGRANEFLAFQSADASEAPPAGVNALFASKRSGDWADAADEIRVAAYERMSVSLPVDWNGWLARSAYLLWLGRAADATDAAVEAFKACPLNETALQTCASAVARPYSVATRDNATVRLVLDFLLYGENGKDGVAKTADDIPDPLPAIRAKLGNY